MREQHGPGNGAGHTTQQQHPKQFLINIAKAVVLIARGSGEGLGAGIECHAGQGVLVQGRLAGSGGSGPVLFQDGPDAAAVHRLDNG